MDILHNINDALPLIFALQTGIVLYALLITIPLLKAFVYRKRSFIAYRIKEVGTKQTQLTHVALTNILFYAFLGLHLDTVLDKMDANQLLFALLFSLAMVFFTRSLYLYARIVMQVTEFNEDEKIPVSSLV